MNQNKNINVINKIIKDWNYYLTEEQLKQSIYPLQWNDKVEYQGKIISFFEMAAINNLSKVFKIFCEDIENNNISLSSHEYSNLWSFGIKNNSLDCLKLLNNLKINVSKKNELNKQIIDFAFTKTENKKNVEVIEWILANFDFEKEIKIDIKKDSELLKAFSRGFNSYPELKFQDTLSGKILEKSITNKNAFLIKKIIDCGFKPTEHFYLHLIKNNHWELANKILMDEKTPKEKINFTYLLGVIFHFCNNQSIIENGGFKNANKMLDLSLIEVSKEHKKKNLSNIKLPDEAAKNLLDFSVKHQTFEMLHKVKANFSVSVVSQINPITIPLLLDKKTQFSRNFIDEIIKNDTGSQKMFIRYFLEGIAREKKGTEQRNKLKKLLALSKDYSWVKEKINLELPSINSGELIAEIQKNLLNMDIEETTPTKKIKML